MAALKYVIFALLMFVLELQQIVTETANSLSQSDTSNTELLSSPLSFQYTSVNRSKEDKFHIRKCCGRGQVYNFNWEEEVADRKERCVEYSITAYPPSSLSPHIEHQQQIFFGPEKNWPQHYAVEDFEIKTGFPSNCTEVLLLQTDVFVADLFYPLASGQLIVPHRFWLFDRKDYCIEDYFENEDFSKGRRVAIICSSHGQTFPSSAIDDHGKLQLDFIQSTTPVELSALAGRTVIRKCCDPNEVFSMQFHLCVKNQGFKTHYFDKLQGTEGEELFFHIGLPNCVDPAYRLSTANFQLASNGSIETNSGDTRSDSSDQLFSTERCIEDVVDIDYAGLPMVSIQAFYCGDMQAIEFSEPDYPVDSGSFYENDRNESDKIKTPKCCPPGQVMDERNICQPLSTLDESSDSDWIVSQALNSYLLNTHNIATIMTHNNSSLSCQLTRVGLTDDSWIKPIFQSDGENELLLSIHFYIGNYWDLKIKQKPFCVDLAIFRDDKQIFHHPYIFRCTSDFHVSIYYPILHSISVAGLLLTFIIYFFVPATGSAKLVTSGLGAGSRRSRISTMAMMLTGRILLCHVITLALAFICLTVAQREHIKAAETSCVTIGYITYGALIASFSWLTVYCFDYYRIFSGSFKVSNEILFIPYSAFGWGVPIFAVTAALIAQFQSKQLGVPDTANPNIGLMNCWFPENGNSALIFFYAPVGSLLLIDIACFLSLLFNPNLMHCWKKKQGLAIRSNKRSQKGSREQQDFKMALKLFFITGIPWVIEVAGWLPVYLYGASVVFKDNSQLQYFFYFGNLLNSLRGVVIFIIFILLQRDVRHYLTLRMKRIFHKGSSNANRLHRANTDGGPSVSTQQSTNRRMSMMSSQTSITLDGGGHHNSEPQVGFVEVTIM